MMTLRPRGHVTLYYKYKLLQSTFAATLFNLGEEIIALVVNEDKCREIFDFDFPDCFHTELGVFEEFYFLDRILGKDSGGTAD